MDRARRLLLGAVASEQDPRPISPPNCAPGVRRRAKVAEHSRARTEGAADDEALATARGGDLRVSILGVTRPYVDRGSPLDPAWEYVLVRLRLENLGGDPITYDANQFRLRSLDETVHSPVPLAIPDELYYGALEGNRLASGVVGTVAYAVGAGCPPLRCSSKGSRRTWRCESRLATWCRWPPDPDAHRAAVADRQGRLARL